MTNHDTVTEPRVDEIHIDIVKLIRQLLHRAVYIAAAAVIGLLLAYLVFNRGYAPQYSTTALMHVEYPPLEAESEEEMQILLQQRQSKDPVNICAVLLSSRGVLEEVIDQEGLPYTYQQMSQMITLVRTASAEFFQITVSGPDADEIVRIAECLAKILPERAGELMEEGEITVEDLAGEPTETTARPSIRNKLVLGAAAGMVLAAAMIVCLYLFSGKIHDEDHLAQAYPGVPLLALIPGTKKGGRTKGGKGATALYSGDAQAEAYKLLRTNLTYAFPGEQTDRVIGLTSSLGDEGRSVASVELTRAMAGTGKKILLVEADMRAPVLAQRLGLKESVGLSGLLSGQGGADSAVAACTADTDGGKVSFDVMAAGAVPLDPSVLLASEEMEQLLGKLRGQYDYVLLDLPPAAAVTDALIAAHMVDGMAVVVRAEDSERKGLAETMRRLRMANANVLGFIFCGAAEGAPKSGKKKA